MLINLTLRILDQALCQCKQVPAFNLEATSRITNGGESPCVDWWKGLSGFIPNGERKTGRSVCAPSRFSKTNLLLFSNLSNLLLNCLRFVFQILPVLLEPVDSLLLGHKAGPKIHGIIAPAKTGTGMTPALRSVVATRGTTHAITSFHIIFIFANISIY